MAPNNFESTGTLLETDEEVLVPKAGPTKYVRTSPHKPKIVWYLIVLFAYFHLVAAHGLYLMFTSAKIWTSLSVFVFHQMGILGIGAGVHRLWSHQSYKAKWPLRLLLATFHTLAFQGPVIDWARDHRSHHKYNETDADPYNAQRGFFYAHIGWVFYRKDPEVLAKAKGIDCSDLFADPILRYQRKYYFYIMPILCFVLPTAIPMYLWGETFANSYALNIFRYILTLNVMFAVNSVGHRWGSKPYDKSLNPSENVTLSMLTLGEGWHNYHHAFPWDYKTGEFGRSNINLATAFIDLMQKVGLASELKTASEDMIKKRVLRTGDGSHNIWGWGDKDEIYKDKNKVIIDHSKIM